MIYGFQGLAAFLWLIVFAFPAVASDETALADLQCGIVGETLPAAVSEATGEEFTVLMIGSSSTAGTGAGGAENAYPARTAHHLNAPGRAPAIRAVARGIGGERAHAAAARLERAILEIMPDIVVWQVGTNDALGNVPLGELVVTLEKGIATARAHGLPVVLVDPQFFPRISDDPNYAQTVQFIGAFGAREGVPVVKRYARMKRALSFGESAMTALLAKDRFHMSPLAHECLALDLAAVLAPALGKNATIAAGGN